jgi:hypothetical protein
MFVKNKIKSHVVFIAFVPMMDIVHIYKCKTLHVLKMGIKTLPFTPSQSHLVINIYLGS